MKILLTGSNGMLGNALVPLLRSRNHIAISTDIDTKGAKDIKYLDIRDYNSIERAIVEISPEFIVHLGAETDVDFCEQNPDDAFATNAMGTQNVALACRKHGLPILYMSSVGVFDGDKTSLYIESDIPMPKNIYGVTKLEGERYVRDLVAEHFIVRAGWMFGGGKQKDKKFVGKIIQQVKNGSTELRVVNDKIGTPTYTKALSDHLERLINTKYWGTFHCCCKGICTRVDVARAILKYMGMDKKVKINEVSSANYPLPAIRPYSECMDNLMLRLRGMDKMKHWNEYLAEYIKEF